MHLGSVACVAWCDGRMCAPSGRATRIIPRPFLCHCTKGPWSRVRDVTQPWALGQGGNGRSSVVFCRHICEEPTVTKDRVIMVYPRRLSDGNCELLLHPYGNGIVQNWVTSYTKSTASSLPTARHRLHLSQKFSGCDSFKSTSWRPWDISTIYTGCHRRISH